MSADPNRKVYLQNHSTGPQFYYKCLDFPIVGMRDGFNIIQYIVINLVV